MLSIVREFWLFTRFHRFILVVSAPNFYLLILSASTTFSTWKILTMVPFAVFFPGRKVDSRFLRIICGDPLLRKIKKFLGKNKKFFVVTYFVHV